MLGDGIYTVALAWQVFQLSNTPTALSVVGVAWLVPEIFAVLFGGVLADRVDRRHVMIFSDIVRVAAVGTLGLLAVSGELRLWHVWVLVAFYGAGNSVFYPAYTALIPELLPRNLLVQAAALRQFVRPLMLRIVGPALGGVLVASLGAGSGFLIDAGSFGASTLALLLMSACSRTRPHPRSVRAVVGDMRQGLRFVLSQRWLSTTLLAVTLAMVFFLGPVFVLMPYVVKNHLHGGADGLGLVFAAGGVGALVASLALGQRSAPHRPLVIVYVAWAVACFSLIGYGTASTLWQAALVSVVSIGSLVVGQILWEATLQRCVPGELLGRVASFDSFVSSGLTPVSLALVGPVAGALGALATLRWAGLFAGGVLIVFLGLLLGLRATSARQAEALGG